MVDAAPADDVTINAAASLRDAVDKRPASAPHQRQHHHPAIFYAHRSCCFSFY